MVCTNQSCRHASGSRDEVRGLSLVLSQSVESVELINLLCFVRISSVQQMVRQIEWFSIMLTPRGE